MSFFRVLLWLCICLNLLIFAYFSFLSHWQIGVLEVSLGILLANFPLPFMLNWCERMSKDLQGTWIHFMPYTIPLLVGLGGTAAYISGSLNGFNEFSLYLIVPVAQGTAFWVLLAVIFCIYPFIDNRDSAGVPSPAEKKAEENTFPAARLEEDEIV
ncbi:hypothetical protein ACJJIF_12655 [Microbulbifer sp. SSSA002]|uniref:hypothetical protein n=1 Tax=Microbulbifer sp. SSSA002 TaxID=3243376 RepID=UPI0040390174